LDKLKLLPKGKKTADKEREQNTASENMSEILENILNKPESSIETKSGSADLLIIGAPPEGLPRCSPFFHVFQGYPCAIVVLQHMPPGFTKPLAERLTLFVIYTSKKLKTVIFLRPAIFI